MIRVLAAIACFFSVHYMGNMLFSDLLRSVMQEGTALLILSNGLALLAAFAAVFFVLKIMKQSGG